jgi:PAS domain S-box-containing protein
MTPVYVKGKIHAMLDFTKEADGQDWSESEINLAALVADVFSGAFERDAMERQFSMIEHSPNLNLYITPEAAIEYINPAVNAVTGYTKPEIMAQGLGLIFSETALTDLKENYIPEALRGGQILFETKITRKDGEQRVLMNSIFQAGKNNFGIFASDLTEIRRLEADLVAAKDLAECNSRAKSEFLSRMSHEMLTPMNCLMGMMQIVKIEPQEAGAYFKEMDDALGRLLELIRNVLNISEIEYDVFKLVPAEFSFKDIIYEVLKNIGPHVEAKKQKINYDINISMSQILIGDRERLKQVCLNLLGNAVKFTPDHGEIILKADSLSEDEKNIMLQIEIADNGPGIPEDQKDKLFAVFEQIDGGAAREHGGIGIGLPLSKRIIEMMGGKISVESESGKGAKFTFTCELQKA